MWIHENLRLSPDRLSYRAAEPLLRRNPLVQASASDPRDYLNRFLMPLFLGSSVIVMAFTLFFIVSLAFGGKLRVVGQNDESREFKFFGFGLPLTKSAFLNHISRGQYSQYAKHQNFIAERISRVGKNVDSREIARQIIKQSVKSDFDPLMVAAVIYAESTFNKHAVSPVGAIGLMQLMPFTGQHSAKMSGVEWRGIKGLKDPGYNIQLGIAYLKYLEDMFDGNKRLALMAYNWGPANVLSALKNRSPIPSSIKGYANRVMAVHHAWENAFDERIADKGQQKLVG